MISDVQSLSCRLYDVMEEVGASEHMRRLAKQTATSVEIFQAIVLGPKRGVVFICGSRFEGSMVYDTLSDSDVICYTNEFNIIKEHDGLKQGKQMNRLLIRDEYTYPGYVKLQAFEEDQPVTINLLLNLAREKTFTKQDVLNFIRRNRDVDCLGRVCVKHVPVGAKHGPASKKINEKGQHVADSVIAMLCKHVPDFASEWFRRRNKFQWLSEQQVSDMNDMGCLLVGVGHEYSAEGDIEWRLSFTRQERLLMTSLNPTQHKVYILLKIIRKEWVQPLFGDIEVLTSYHLKTLILHTVENTSPTSWTKNNIANCVIHCLNILYSWVRCGVCPNYFIKDQNLFAKKAFRHAKIKLTVELRRFLTMKYTLFFCLHTSDIGSMLTETKTLCFRSTALLKRNLLKLGLLSSISSSEVITVYGKLDKEIEQSHGTCMSLLKYLQSTKTVAGHTEKETETAFAFMIPWVYLHMAKQFASDSLKASNDTRCYRLIRDAFEHFRRATSTDRIQVHLAKASYYFMKRRFSDCLTLLNRVQTKWTMTTASICCCYGVKIHSCNTEEYLTLIDTVPLNQISNRLAGCVVFLPSYKPLTPLPLQLEMKRWMLVSPSLENEMFYGLFMNAMVDGIVYLYFLKYLVSKELNKPDLQLSALVHLRGVIKNDLGHKDTAYNLLGWVYIQETRIGEAIHCFMESWRIRPFASAAIFHMNSLSDIFYRLIHSWQTG